MNKNFIDCNPVYPPDKHLSNIHLDFVVWVFLLRRHGTWIGGKSSAKLICTGGNSLTSAQRRPRVRIPPPPDGPSPPPAAINISCEEDRIKPQQLIIISINKYVSK